MIKFFRHIRKTLISENQMGKYFKYAIGEILLVVIGILIALSINNWNSKRIENNDKQALIKSLRQELNENLDEFQERQIQIRKINQNTTKVLNYSASLIDEIVFDSLRVYISEMLTFPAPRYKTSLLSSAKSSGKINLLAEDLKTSLSDFEISLNNYDWFLKATATSLLDDNWYDLAINFNSLQEFHNTILNIAKIKTHPEIPSSNKELSTFIKNIKTYKYIYKMHNENIVEEAWITNVMSRINTTLSLIDKKYFKD